MQIKKKHLDDENIKKDNHLDVFDIKRDVIQTLVEAWD